MENIKDIKIAYFGNVDELLRSNGFYCAGYIYGTDNKDEEIYLYYKEDEKVTYNIKLVFSLGKLIILESYVDLKCRVYSMKDEYTHITQDLEYIEEMKKEIKKLGNNVYEISKN